MIIFRTSEIMRWLDCFVKGSVVAESVQQVKKKKSSACLMQNQFIERKMTIQMTIIK